MIGYISILVIISVFAQSYAKPNDRIVNGTDAELGEFPHIVSIQDRDFGHFCGGSIVNNRCVLTASHCLYQKDHSKISIQYGVVEIGGNANSIPVEAAVLHGNYNNVSGIALANDVAILKLASPIVFSANVGPVKLPKPREEFQCWSDAKLAGWGSNYTCGTVMEHLQKVDILLYPDDECESIHGSKLSREYHTCAGLPEGWKGQCSGDSGGPLTVKGVQVGIVSWSKKPCAYPGYPGVFARVANYVDWILNECSH